MDLTSLKNTVANLTLYDIKAGVRKVQNGMTVIASVVVYLSCRKILTRNSGDELYRDGGQG